MLIADIYKNMLEMYNIFHQLNSSCRRQGLNKILVMSISVKLAGGIVFFLHSVGLYKYQNSYQLLDDGLLGFHLIYKVEVERKIIIWLILNVRVPRYRIYKHLLVTIMTILGFNTSHVPVVNSGNGKWQFLIIPQFRKIPFSLIVENV